MPAPKVGRRDFYVYALFREDGITPFYIGKGRGDRWLDHFKNLRGGKGRHKESIILNMLNRNIEVPKSKLVENLSSAEALQIEIDLIQLIGRRPKGPLVNQTRGGEGLVDPSPAARKNMSAGQVGRVHPPEVRRRMSEAHRGSRPSQETIEKKRRAATGRTHSIETRRKISEKATGRRQSAESIEKRRRSMIGRFLGRPLSETTKAKISDALTGRKLPSDVLQK